MKFGTYSASCSSPPFKLFHILVWSSVSSHPRAPSVPTSSYIDRWYTPLHPHYANPLCLVFLFYCILPSCIPVVILQVNVIFTSYNIFLFFLLKLFFFLRFLLPLSPLDYCNPFPLFLLPLLPFSEKPFSFLRRCDTRAAVHTTTTTTPTCTNVGKVVIVITLSSSVAQISHSHLHRARGIQNIESPSFYYILGSLFQTNICPLQLLHRAFV